MTDPDPALAAARARLEALFAAFDRLTPDELARIGFQAAPDEAREPLLDALDAAAERTGRVALVDEARGAARDAVMQRYAAGTLHPTFAGLNWGLSQGRVEDRVAIAETLADAAAAAVLEDALEPEIAAALALDASAITGLATGEASEGSLERVVHRSGEPQGRSGPGRGRVLAALGGGVAGLAIAGLGGAGLGALLAIAGLEAVRRVRRPG